MNTSCDRPTCDPVMPCKQCVERIGDEVDRLLDLARDGEPEPMMELLAQVQQQSRGPLPEWLICAFLEVLAADAENDRRPAFAFRPGWWTWEADGGARNNDDLTIAWLRRWNRAGSIA